MPDLLVLTDQELDQVSGGVIPGYGDATAYSAGGNDTYSIVGHYGVPHS